MQDELHLVYIVSKLKDDTSWLFKIQSGLTPKNFITISIVVVVIIIAVVIVVSVQGLGYLLPGFASFTAISSKIFLLFFFVSTQQLVFVLEYSSRPFCSHVSVTCSLYTFIFLVIEKTSNSLLTFSSLTQYILRHHLTALKTSFQTPGFGYIAFLQYQCF